jgi:hypothetical protein
MGIKAPTKSQAKPQTKKQVPVVVREVPLRVRSLEGGATKAVPKPQENARVLEPPLPDSTLFLFPPFLFYRKEIGSMVKTPDPI